VAALGGGFDEPHLGSDRALKAASRGVVVAASGRLGEPSLPTGASEREPVKRRMRDARRGLDIPAFDIPALLLRADDAVTDCANDDQPQPLVVPPFDRLRAGTTSG
jgi:hypothetical protein